MEKPPFYLLNERPRKLRGNSSARDSLRFEEAARLLGIPVFDMPSNWKNEGSLEDILFYLPSFPAPVPTFINGFIPFLDDYEDLYQYLLRKNLVLVNSPAECARALRFDQAYPRLQELTPPSRIVTNPAEMEEAFACLSFPLFIKGAVRSLKAEGWTSCTAHSPEDARALCTRLLSSAYQSRGSVILRELVPLRHERTSEKGFPLGREFRLFLFRNKVLSLGYYWDGQDPLSILNPEEEKTVRSLAEEASRRLDVPYLAIDVAQTEAGAWTVIEPGDAQFAGFGHNEVRVILSELLAELG